MGIGESSIVSDAVDMKPALRIIEDMSPVSSGDIIPLLQQIQAAYGYLPQGVIAETSSTTAIPVSRIYGVATFYEQFHFKPQGKHTIRCCRGTACHVKNGPGIVQAIKLDLGIEPGQTTRDMLFTLETVACLGCCFLAPVMMIDGKYYGHLTASKIADILDDYRNGKTK